MGTAERLPRARAAGTGEPEVVNAASRTPLQTVTAVSRRLASSRLSVLVSHAGPDHAAAVRAAHPMTIHHPDARMLVVGTCEPGGPTASRGGVVIATAGTSDLGVAWECIRTLEAVGFRPQLLADVGTAGLHRLLEVREILEAADVLIVIAGTEAALVPVVAGLVRAPVIAVPTSVGNGAAQHGMTALHGLLASAAPGIGVVDVDNGLGAALLARRILLAGSGGAV